MAHTDPEQLDILAERRACDRWPRCDICGDGIDPAAEPWRRRHHACPPPPPPPQLVAIRKQLEARIAARSTP